MQALAFAVLHVPLWRLAHPKAGSGSPAASMLLLCTLTHDAAALLHVVASFTALHSNTAVAVGSATASRP